MFFRTILSLQNFLQDIFFNCQSTTIQYFGWLSPEFSGKSFIVTVSTKFQNWWAYLELNQGPRPYQGRALTN